MIARGSLSTRIEQSGNPALSGGDVMAFLRGLANQRIELYAAYVDKNNYIKLGIGYDANQTAFELRVTKVGNTPVGGPGFTLSSVSSVAMNAPASSGIIVAINQNNGTRLAFSGGNNYVNEGPGSPVSTIDLGADLGAPAPFRFRDIHIGRSYFLDGANGQSLGINQATELTVIANGVLTQATTITIPTNAVVLAVSQRVTVQPGGTATYVLTGTTSATQFNTGANVSTVAGTTDAGTKNCPFYDAQTNETVTYTFNGLTNNALGRIRTTIYYYLSTPPTS